MRAFLLFVVLLLASLSARAEPVDGTSPESGQYPLELSHFEFTSQGQELQMAFMDSDPDGQKDRVVVLLHGKNFCGPYWHQTIDRLVELEFRVIVPEQVGFCRSSLPARYQFTLHQLAHNTRALLDGLGVESARIMGHSMGGMLAMRYGLMYPESSAQIILVNPIGLEDWLGEGVPYIPVDELYRAEREKDFEGIRAYQKQSYYDGQWSEDYEHWARMLAATYTGEHGQRVAWNHALTADMVMTGPVIHEVDNLDVPVVLLIGDRDRTAIGRDRVDEELADRLGDYPRLSRELAARLPEAELVLFKGIGHMPHIEDETLYLNAVTRALGAESENEESGNKE